MVSAPADTPVTIPAELTVAAGVLADHTPPAGVQVKVVLTPVQIGVVPVTVPTVGKAWLVMFTLSYLVPHVLVAVYLTVMVPEARPVMTPVAPMPRIPPPYMVFHAPPAGEPVSVVDEPTQRLVVE